MLPSLNEDENSVKDWEEAEGGGGGKKSELKPSPLCWQNNLLHSVFSQPQLFLHYRSTVIPLRAVQKKQ